MRERVARLGTCKDLYGKQANADTEAGEAQLELIDSTLFAGRLTA
jgi:hypothetical protein